MGCGKVGGVGGVVKNIRVPLKAFFKATDRLICIIPLLQLKTDIF